MFTFSSMFFSKTNMFLEKRIQELIWGLKENNHPNSILK